MNIYEKPQGFNPSYGTSGFRYDASLLHSTFYRCGALMAIRVFNSNKVCGIMITASHNKESDNGVKLIDYNGEMIDDNWEKYATAIAQSQSNKEAMELIENLKNNEHLDNRNKQLLIGYDTRPSSLELYEECKKGANMYNIDVIDLGFVTTPELHFYVNLFNNNNIQLLEKNVYIHNLLESFKGLNDGNYTPLYIDCANGIGAKKLEYMQPILKSQGFDIELYNTGNGKLNYLCGADFVEKDYKNPITMDNIDNKKCCSLDGDADRIVYFINKKNQMYLINGDRISILLGIYILDICKHIDYNPKICIVQTAYSNGAATNFIKTYLPTINIVCTSTGVKNLHQMAKKYDIGIYFEANGHGTILFNPEFIDHLENDLTDNKYISKLLLLYKLLSQSTGDALANMLVVETILSTFTFDKWLGLYIDLPCKQTKIEVNRNLFQTFDSERKCLYPIGLQDKIDDIINQYKNTNSRAFVRPSGTEDIVRIYVEANTIDIVEEINTKITKEVEKVNSFYIRNIESSDYKDHLNLYKQLTIINPNEITIDMYEEFVNNLNNSHQIIGIIDRYTNKLIGTATIFIENKLIHNMGKVGHIEDVVIDEKYKGNGLGKDIVFYATSIAKKNGCYKVILDCSDDNIGFYIKSGYIKKGNQMALYFSE